MKLYLQPTIYTLLAALTACLLPSTANAGSFSVPFTAQAPEGRWVQPWEDMCEEASIIMVDQYYQKRELTVPRSKALLLHIFHLKNKHFGRSLDESAETMTALINNFLPWEAHIVNNPSLEQIKEQIDLERPVIVPVSGKDLKNPRFRNGGPRYHVLVISGYNDQKQEFITQEPGTKYGLDFRYTYDTIMDANHDLVSGDIREGSRRMIFTISELDGSKDSDGDKDGLTKAEEIAFGTSLTEQDTDRDGFMDGTEVSNGYSPTTNEMKLPHNSLIKLLDNPRVYLFANNRKHPIASEAAFTKGGWHWQAIKTVSERFLNAILPGDLIE